MSPVSRADSPSNLSQQAKDGTAQPLTDEGIADGTQQPLDSTKNSYDTIKALDPYHPVSLVMNCENYHFEEYTSGADIILTDVYPIGVNTTWSTKFK